MKTKKLLFAIALPLALTACTNDEFVNESMSATQKGELVTLPENYLLAGYMGSNANTRSIYDETKFAWLPFDGSTPDAIGLCWRGGGYTSDQSVVYTNYKFEHYGWLGKGETKPALNCDENLDNGQLLSALLNNEVALLAGEWTVANTTKYPDLRVDAKNGLFSTDNSTIFKGDYIVYYPYNDKFNEVGYIPVTAPSNIKRDINGLTDKNYTKELAKEVFVAGVMSGVDGGQQNGVFSTNFVSGGVVVKINNKTKANFNVHKVILLSENGFATEAKLDAAKVAAGAKGASLYSGEPTEFSNTLVAEFYNGSKNNAQADLTVEMDKTQRVAFAVLPTTDASALKNAKVILIDDSEKSFLVDAKLSKVVSLDEGWNTIEVNVDGEFTENAYAYDTESLITLLTERSDEGAERERTINVLNKITLDPDYTFTIPYGNDTQEEKLSVKFKNSDRSIYMKENVTLTGMGSIVVPADLQLAFKVVSEGDKKPVMTIDVPLIIENRGCCGTDNGTVIFRTASKKIGTYKIKSIKNEGTIYLGNDLNGVVDITVDELNNNGGYINAYGVGKDDAKRSSNIIIGKLTNTYIARDSETDEQKVNNGRVNVVAKFLDPTTGNKTAATSGTTKRVQMTIGELQNNADAYVLVGKRTILNVTGTSANAGRIKVETANVTTNEEDAQLYIGSKGAITNTGLIENFGVINNEGSLKNNDAEKAVIVDHVGCQFGGKAAQAIPGEYICDVEDTDVTKDGDRLGYAMGANMPTTTVRFVGKNVDSNQNTIAYTYNLNGYKTGDILPYNFIIAAESPIELKTKSGSTVTIGGELTIDKDSKLNLSSILLTVNNVVTVNGEMKVSPIASAAATLETKTAFTAKDTVNVNNAFEVATFAMTKLEGDLNIAEKAKATFNYATYTDVAETININGEFVRVVSTGSQTANPAQVWCKDYARSASAVIPNGLPQAKSQAK